MNIRQLDFETGRETSRWQQGESAYQRDLFVSREDNIVVVRLAGPKGTIRTQIGLVPHQPQNDIFPTRIGQDSDYLLAHKPYTGDPIQYSVTAETGFLVLRGRYRDNREFGGVARVVSKASSVELLDGRMAVKDADEVLVLLKLFANTRDADAVVPLLRNELDKLPQEYSSLFESHAKKHRELFGRMSLDLGGEPRHFSNAELIKEVREGELSPALAERLFEFGRYLLMCSSRSGGLPANLQGLWSGTWTPAWSCDYTVNVKMAYWQALPGNMAEVTQAYFDYFDSLLADWRLNAKKFYG